MASRNDIVKLAVDSYNGKPQGNYSVAETQEALREALIELNGGSTKLDYRAMRSHPEMFSIIEEIITKTTLAGLPENSPLYDFTDFRNVALGDSMKFDIRDDSELYVVSQIAEGTQGIRRQRLTGNQVIVPPMKLYAIKVYEELNRILAGRVNFNDAIDKVGKSFTKKINEATYQATVNALAGLNTPYKQTGTFDIDKLITIIDHVEAATGTTAKVITSKQGARQIANIVGGDAQSAKEDLYNIGYYTHIGENPVIALKNAHVAGTTNFVLNNDIIVVGSDDKFVKLVTEGDTLVIDKDPYDNADLSKEYFMAQRWGIAVAMASEAGYYDI